MIRFLLDIPKPSRGPVLNLAVEIAKEATTLGPERWGLTYFDDWAIRINVGWTEIFTATRDHLRLIVDRHLASEIKPAQKVVRGRDKRGYYPRIPNSGLVELSYTASQLPKAVERLRPALSRAIALAGRRRVGRGVRTGHNEWAVRQVEQLAGRSLPSPGYTSTSGRPAALAEGVEGDLTRVVISRYERDPALRTACIRHYGSSCTVCRDSLGRRYGPLGEGVIQVHHLEPMADTGRKVVNAVRDLRPVCPTCHVMLHRRKPPLATEELRDMLIRSKRKAVN